MNPLIQRETTSPLFLIVLAIVCFASLQNAHAVSPPPDGAYPNFTTAEGQNALKDLTTGAANTALGAYSMFSTTTASFNTAVGAGALDLNTGDANTAIGVAALLLNTGTNNTAVGVDTLGLNTSGESNAAVGAIALYNNTTGNFNTANGHGALFSNTTGDANTANGEGALVSNTTGNDNTANGAAVLVSNTTGSGNVALGFQAGFNATTGNNNVYIGAGMQGVAGQSNACYIASIFGQTSVNGVPVLVNSSNLLGTMTSSKRFKSDIKPMDKASEALFSLKPVSFRYNNKIDPKGTSQFGLVAEDVEKVNPDLIVRDKDGKPYTVRYEAVNAMLLNEFLKEHNAFVREEHKVEKLEATVATLVGKVKEQAAQIRKVSAQLEVSKAAPQTVVNN